MWKFMEGFLEYILLSCSFLCQDTAVGLVKSPRWSHNAPSLIMCLLLKIGRQQSIYSMT